jgi:hypothetical protein
MAQVLAFPVSDADRDAVVSVLEEALRRARAGEVVDVAVVLAVRDDDGPQFWTSYYGQRAYATILAGVSALDFDLHYRRYNPE